VEDNPYGRVLLNTILTELGHRADFVGAGAAAADAVANGHYDAVLMDMKLPDMDGLEAARRIRALAGATGRVPIVGIAGAANATEEAVGRAAGITSYVTRPLSAGALAPMLASLAPPPAS
jgi:CheY-like chemotaxis protein